MTFLERLKALDEKATPGPWRTEKRAVSDVIQDGYGDGGYRSYSTFLIRGRHDDAIYSEASRFDREGSSRDYPHDPDAALIAFTRNALPDLIAVIEAAHGNMSTIMGVRNLKEALDRLNKNAGGG